MKLNEIRIPYLVRLIFFWMIYFAIFRLLFVIYHHAKVPDGQHGDTVLAFVNGLRLDLSAACMAVLIPFFLWALQKFYKKKAIDSINRWVNYSLISLVSLLCIANIKMYGEWGTLLNARALNYIIYPKEILTFISLWSVSLLLIICALFVFIGIKLYSLLVTNFSAPIENMYFRIAQILLIPGLLLLGYRGGFQLTPINESSAYYSNLQINNHVAINPLWYLGHSIVEANETNNPYIFDSKIEEAKSSTEKLLLKSTEASDVILKTKKPNVVIIILESWTADLIKKLGGEENVTPHFDELTKEGLLFSQIYSSGFRTEQGLVSVLSGYPAQPNNSIVTTPSKAEKLPSLSTELGKQGYQSSFYYGGEVEFANMKTYLSNTHFVKIIDKNNFSGKELNSKWGAHDEFVFSKQLHELKSEKQPFFSVVLTLSTHEPFEVTMQTPFTGTEEGELFKKAAYYTDYCLYNYFVEAKKQPWYENTLFVLVADHGHRLPRERDMNLPEGRRITTFITGGALVDSLKGKVFDKICNQHDLPATLLKQLGLSSDDFKWSKDVFNANTKPFAYYSNENVLGWITPEQSIAYYYATQKADVVSPSKNEKLDNEKLNEAKAYLQTLYQNYLDY